MRQYTVKRYAVETPEQLIALYEIKPEGHRSMLMLAKVWRAERVRRQNCKATRGIDPGPIVRVRVCFDTGKRRCDIIRFGRSGSIINTSGTLPYNDALRYCRENNLRLMEPEENP